MRLTLSQASPFIWRACLLSVAGTALAFEVARPAEAPMAAPASTALPSDAAVPPTAAHGRAPRKGIAEHPLFHASRQPWRPPLAAPPAPPAPVAPPPAVALAPPRGYVLVGIVLSGDMRTAMLHTQNGAKVVKVVEGQVLDGWTVRGIDRDGLHLEASGAVCTILFRTPRHLDGGGRSGNPA